MAFIPLLSGTHVATILAPVLISVLLMNTLVTVLRPDIADVENRVKPVSIAEMNNSYDFIIIGAGAAGSVLANRLSENTNWRVLLLEAGPDEPEMCDVPFAYNFLQGSSLDWQFKPEPSDTSCLAMTNHQCSWPRGKALGGTTILNGMIYSRGNKKDYDNWEKQGNPGWDHDSIFKYFMKSEDMRIDEFKGSSYHSTGGGLSIEHYRYRTPITNYLVKAGTEIGYEIVDANAEKQTGFMVSHSFLRDGLRCSVEKGFLRPASKRENLHVSILSTAEKILIRKEGDKKIAYGVRFRVDGVVKEVKADREVIVSAGSLQSPQLLMLSGIGPKEHLEEVGIDVIQDAPGVGENLQDHVGVGGLTYLVDPPEDYKGDYPFTYILPDTVTPQAAVEFAVHHTGPFYAAYFTEATAFVNTKYVDPADDFPDIQFLISSDASVVHGCLNALIQAETEYHAKWCEDILKQHSYSITPMYLRPKSKGYIKLRTTDVNDHPLIVSNFFQEPSDIEVLIEGAKIAHKISESPTMKKLNARAHHNPNNDCAAFELMSDDYLRCLARHFTRTIYHVCGTCKMGPANDSMAVVDHRLKVHGVDGLRVIDASIMPRITSGNTQAPTMMIAEKGADMIKEDYGVL